MEKFIRIFNNNLETTVSYCCAQRAVEVTPSDFDMVEMSLEEMEKLFN